MKKPMIVIAGPTAVGKTATAVELAKRINGEIISADSMQVYKYMDIGTAKPTKKEMQGIPHYLIDELDPDDEFNVTVFQQKAKQYCNDIIRRGKIPIIVGGTGFYIQSLVYDIHFDKTNADIKYRNDLEHLADEKGPIYIHNELKKIDPKSAEKIHPNNVKRVIRALEYFKQTNEPISKHNEREKKRISPYNLGFFVLHANRELMYKRIDLRVDIMIKNGLVDEVKNLLDRGFSPSLVSMQGLGYKEFIDYFNKQITLDEAINILKRDTRHFAKRQITWFKRETNVNWISADKYEFNSKLIAKNIINYLEEYSIIL